MPYDVNKCYRNFGLALKILRRRNKWTQMQFAEKSSIARSAIADLECGRRHTLYVDELLLFCNAFNISINDFLELCESIN